MIWSILLLIAVTLERLGELWLARRNTRTLTARGAFEVAAAPGLGRGFRGPSGFTGLDFIDTGPALDDTDHHCAG